MGGVVILDDFGYWEGCREAFYDFGRQAAVGPLGAHTGILDQVQDQQSPFLVIVFFARMNSSERSPEAGLPQARHGILVNPWAQPS
jgi:hypothetical protein